MAFVVDMLTGATNRRIERETRRLTDAQLRNFERIARLFDVSFRDAQNLIRRGVFDPATLIGTLEAESRRQEGKDLGTLAGAMRAMGYRPGDTAPQTQLRAIASQHRQFRDKLRFTTPADMAARQMALWGSVPHGGIIPASNSMQQLQQLHLSQMTDPTAFFTSIMPYLKDLGWFGRPKRPTNTPPQ